nr:serine--tRNA ligase [Tanacetum cinerariifolium]
MKGLFECKASESNVRRIQFKDIIKEVKDHLKTYSSTGIDISWFVCSSTDSGRSSNRSSSITIKWVCGKRGGKGGLVQGHAWRFNFLLLHSTKEPRLHVGTVALLDNILRALLTCNISFTTVRENESGGDVRAMIQDARLKKDSITKKAGVKDAKEARNEKLEKIGNFIHDSVPIGKDEPQQGYQDGDEYMFTSLFMGISKSFLIDMVDVLIYTTNDSGKLNFDFMMKCL